MSLVNTGNKTPYPTASQQFNLSRLNQSISVDVMGEKHLPRGQVSFLEAVFPSAGVELILLMVFFLKIKLVKLVLSHIPRNI